MRERRPRIALYSHDTMGLGHMRRNLLVAQALTRLEPAPSILMLFGAREAATYPLPPGVESVTLPALAKGSDGAYRARALELSLEGLVELRARALHAVLDSFGPDLLIVDKVARGAVGELQPSLRSLRGRHGTRLVLGLRDLLDEPAAVQREWRTDRTVEAVRRHYDAVWVYGDGQVCDPVAEYGLPGDVARLVRFTGYLDPRTHWTAPGAEAPALPPRPYVLCMVGGGQDGDRLAEVFAETRRPAGLDGVIITGPYMQGEARARLEVRVAADPTLHLHRFLADTAPFVARAERVITMGGYNSVTEVLAHERPALVVPRTTPREEQLLRAERLASLGLLDLLRPEVLTPAALAAWLATAASPRPATPLDFGGAGRLAMLAREQLALGRRQAAARPTGREVRHAAV